MTRRSIREGTGRTTMPWTVYIVECADNTLYTGITTDIVRRMEAHLAGSGAKYTNRRGPFVVRYTEQQRTRSGALKREAAIKALARSAKLALIAASRPKRRHEPTPASGTATPNP
jgi:putative endonuclease